VSQPGVPEQKGKAGVRRVWHALSYSCGGLRAAWRHEAAFRQETVLAVVLVPLAFFLAHDNLARALMIASVLLVLIMELLNSAIEACVDRISTQHHALAGRAKDLGSAAVFVSLMNVLLVWALALWP